LASLVDEEEEGALGFVGFFVFVFVVLLGAVLLLALAVLLLLPLPVSFEGRVGTDFLRRFEEMVLAAEEGAGAEDDELDAIMSPSIFRLSAQFKHRSETPNRRRDER